jgi:hypothetical protein
VFDHRGVRFVTLDTSALTIRGGGFDQYTMLRDALDAAATDASVRAVVLAQHVPPRDPTPGKASQLGDRKEAALVEAWLADFRARTGKGVAFIGAHVGTFFAGRVDGVPYFVNGNSAKSPATPAGQGGFTGWSLWGVRGDRLAVRVNPHVDAVTVTAPATMVPGQRVTVTASLTQPGGRVVPVAYPVSHRWTVSPSHAAGFDPLTGELTAWRPGDITLTLTVNGVVTSTRVTVTKG